MNLGGGDRGRHKYRLEKARLSHGSHIKKSGRYWMQRNVRMVHLVRHGIVADVRPFTQWSLGQQPLQRLGRQGLVRLGFFDNGFKKMSANRFLLEPADFRSLRMWVQASRVIAQCTGQTSTGLTKGLASQG